MSTGQVRKILSFGGFRLDAAQRSLCDKNGAPIELPSRAFDLLLFMVGRPGEVLEKSMLLAAVWPRAVVEESNLSQSIYLLRRALGEQAGEQKFIATIPGRGYQFVAPIELDAPDAVSMEAADDGTRAGNSAATHRLHLWTWSIGIVSVAMLAGAGVLLWQSRATNEAARTRAASTDLHPPHSVVDSNETSSGQSSLHTIAVLPFTDLSASRDLEEFADGLVDDVITSLATSKNLRVTGRRSAFALKGTTEDVRALGKRLNVEAILKGSVRRFGERTRITTQLFRTSDGLILWSRTLVFEMKDLLSTREAISANVVAELDRSFAGTSTSRVVEFTHTSKGAAYNAYLHGLYFFERRTATDFIHARDSFAHACDLDPDFAMAHAWLARTYQALALLGIGDVQRNDFLGQAALDRALKLNPAIGDLWWVNNYLLGPNTPLELRASKLERALNLVPGDAEALTSLGDIYIQIGRREDAFKVFERAHEVDPLWVQASYWLGVIGYIFKSDRQMALDVAAEVTALSPSDPRGPIMIAWVSINEGSPLEWDRAAASAIAAAPLDNTSHVSVSKDYAELGIWDAALHHARIAREISPDSASGWYAASRALLMSGDISGARNFVNEAMTTKPADYQSLFAQAELQYYEGNCSGAIRSLVLARPSLGQPTPSMFVMPDLDRLPMLVWCQRQLGNGPRALEIVESVNRVLAPPICPGLMEGIQARMAAANDDRLQLIAHLSALVKTSAYQFTFAASEPMIQPYRRDPEVSALLAKMTARAAAWRKAVPKSSTRVPIPPVQVGVDS